ncbi:hypothetical protein B0H63DRAFT_464465 [Podospora didyma]|uniref:Mid2 domain-containing protein n=1 Tax=Podospora didyma TaxID=330526 RepID=A0AAE0NYD1_9PEZI|nr:hypothetical protein B0H63DRAFT_464465 [Podospora didyma]
MSRKPLSLAGAIFLSARLVSCATQCFYVSSNPITDKGIVPCNSSATGQAGSHSSCCNEDTRDACLSSGLCFATQAKTPGALLWIGGCTDPTWRDPSCPQYCNPPVNATGRSGNPRLQTCADKTFCCAGAYANDVECCKNSFTLSRDTGFVIQQLGNRGVGATTTSATTSGPPQATSASDTPKPGISNAITTDTPASGGGSSNTAAILGGVLGSLLLAVLIALAFFVIQNRRLRGELREKKESQPAPGLDYNNYHAIQPSNGSQTLPGTPAPPPSSVSPPKWSQAELSQATAPQYHTPVHPQHHQSPQYSTTPQQYTVPHDTSYPQYTTELPTNENNATQLP